MQAYCHRYLQAKKTLMIKKTTILGIIFFALIFGCAEKQNEELNDKYVLKGNVSGIENDTWIYLFRDGKAIDSTQISENIFELEGRIGQPTGFVLFIKNTQDYSQIWLESGNINFKAQNGAFRDAEIKGSKTQNEQDILNALIKDYSNRRDSLTTILRNPKSNKNLKKSAREGLQIIYDNHLILEQGFIKNNPQSFVSASLIDFYSTTFGKTKTEELYNILDDSIKTSSYGKSINRYLTLNKNLKIGDKYVDFSMTNDKGELINLSDFEGKLLLLDFWASWCGPCIGEYPALKKAYSEFKKDNFEIVSISQDQTKEQWIKAIEKNKLNWVNLWQEEGNRADPYLIYGINGIPDNFLINESGIIVARNLRGDNLISVIVENLGKKASR